MIALKELLLSQLYAINSIVGLALATLNSLQKLADAINSDANFSNNIMNAINLKSCFTDVSILCDSRFMKKDTLWHRTCSNNQSLF